MPTKCAIKSCKNTSENATYEMGITHHRFPRDPEMMQRWIDTTGNGSDWWPGRHDTLCSVHFEQNCFRKLKYTQRLFVWAVPTLKLTSDGQTEANKNKKNVELPPVTTKKTEPPKKIQCINHILETKRVCSKCKMVFNANFESEIAKLEGQSKLIVTKVYHFLEQEFAELTERYGDRIDLTPLAKIQSRTADATGVGRSTITKILSEERQWKKEQQEQCKVGLKLKRKADKEIKRIRKRRISSGVSSDDLSSTDESEDEIIYKRPKKQPKKQHRKHKQIDTDTESNATFVDDNDNNNNGSVIEEIQAPPIQVVNKGEYFNPHNIGVLDGNEAIGTMPTGSVEFEFHNMDPEQRYCGMETTANSHIPHIETQPLVATEQQFCVGVDPSLNTTITIGQPSDTIQAVPYMTEQQYCGVSVEPSLNTTITIGQPSDTIQTGPYMTEHQYCRVNVDPSMNTTITITQPTVACQTEPFMVDQPFCGGVVVPLMTDGQFCSTVVEPVIIDEHYGNMDPSMDANITHSQRTVGCQTEPFMTEQQYCSTVEEPGMTDEQYCSTVEEQGMTGEQYFSTVEEPGMTDEQYCSTVEEQDMTGEQYCSTVEEPGMTDEQYCSTVEEQGMTGEQYCNTVEEPGMTDEQYCSTVEEQGMTGEQYCSTVEEPGMTDEQYCSTVGEPGMTGEQYCNTAGEPVMTDGQYCSTVGEPVMTDGQYCSTVGEPVMTDGQYCSVEVEPSMTNTITISQPVAIHPQDLVAEAQYLGTGTGEPVNFTDGVNYYVIM